MVKKLILLVVFMAASGLGGEHVNQAATGGTPGERLGARAAREYGAEQPSRLLAQDKDLDRTVEDDLRLATAKRF
jgi:hypothetical protein